MRNGFDAKDNSFSLNKYKNTMTRPVFYNKSKKSSLLSIINFNIEKTSQNINNPNAFYGTYFQSLLENKKKNAEKFRTSSMDFYPQFRRNKK